VNPDGYMTRCRYGDKSFVVADVRPLLRNRVPVAKWYADRESRTWLSRHRGYDGGAGCGYEDRHHRARRTRPRTGTRAEMMNLTEMWRADGVDPSKIASEASPMSACAGRWGACFTSLKSPHPRAGRQEK